MLCLNLPLKSIPYPLIVVVAGPVFDAHVIFDALVDNLQSFTKVHFPTARVDSGFRLLLFNLLNVGEPEHGKGQDIGLQALPNQLHRAPQPPRLPVEIVMDI